MKKFITIIGLAAAVSLAGGHAQIISFEETGSGGNLSGDYPIDFINDSLSGITLTADSNLTTASLALGSGASAGTAFGSLGFANAGDASTLSGAITDSVYHSFTLTPTAGYQLNITGVSYNADASSGTSTFNFDLLSSATGFTSSDSLGTFSVINSAAASGTINTSANTSLQGITSTVELRIYVSRSAGNGTAAYYADDGVNGGLFSVDGTVTAIPEPGTWALIGLGSAVVLWRMRRRNTTA
jgi:hypothetical protein